MSEYLIMFDIYLIFCKYLAIKKRNNFENPKIEFIAINNKAYSAEQDQGWRSIEFYQ